VHARRTTHCAKLTLTSTIPKMNEKRKSFTLSRNRVHFDELLQPQQRDFQPDGRQHLAFMLRDRLGLTYDG
jgi:hypothetical protein